MRTRRLAATLAALTTFSAHADLPQDLKACAGIAADAARLACYDALSRTPASAAPVAASAPAGPPAPAAPAPSAADFGLPPSPSEQQATERISAHIAGAFTGWTRGQKITLDNGQVWKCVDENDGYYPQNPANAEVVIERSFFGGYWMDVRPIGRKLRVKRVK